MEFAHQDLKVFIPIVVGLLCFILFWFTHTSEKLKQKFIAKYGFDKGHARFIISSKYMGGAALGLIPLACYWWAFPDTTLAQLGITWPSSDKLLVTILWIVGLCALIIPISMYSGRQEKSFEGYPQIRAKVWNRKMVIHHVASWTCYLLGYEMLFRGVLFFPLVESIGLWPAIAVNIGMYSGTHISKGIEETMGAFIMAIIFSLLTFYTGTIWIAFAVHLSLALSHFYSSFKHHPDIVYQA